MPCPGSHSQPTVFQLEKCVNSYLPLLIIGFISPAIYLNRGGSVRRILMNVAVSRVIITLTVSTLSKLISVNVLTGTRVSTVRLISMNVPVYRVSTTPSVSIW